MQDSFAAANLGGGVSELKFSRQPCSMSVLLSGPQVTGESVTAALGTTVHGDQPSLQTTCIMVVLLPSSRLPSCFPPPGAHGHVLHVGKLRLTASHDTTDDPFSLPHVPYIYPEEEHISPCSALLHSTPLPSFISYQRSKSIPPSAPTH